jgi:hypothetical protein
VAQRKVRWAVYAERNCVAVVHHSRESQSELYHELFASCMMLHHVYSQTLIRKGALTVSEEARVSLGLAL